MIDEADTMQQLKANTTIDEKSIVLDSQTIIDDKSIVLDSQTIQRYLQEAHRERSLLVHNLLKKLRLKRR